MGLYLFRKEQRILNRSDYVNLNRLGKRLVTKHFTLIFNQNRMGITRLGIIVGKKVGNAVKRNRIKRLIREYFRTNALHFPGGIDIVIAAKKDASHLDLWKIKEEIGIVLDKEFQS